MSEDIDGSASTTDKLEGTVAIVLQYRFDLILPADFKMKLIRKSTGNDDMSY